MLYLLLRVKLPFDARSVAPAMGAKRARTEWQEAFSYFVYVVNVKNKCWKLEVKCKIQVFLMILMR